MKCPPNKALGCAAGEPVKPNKNMVDPPSEASIKGDSLALVKNRANPRAILAPIETHSNRMIIFSIGLDYSSHSGHDVDLPHHGGRTSNFS